MNRRTFLQISSATASGSLLLANARPAAGLSVQLLRSPGSIVPVSSDDPGLKHLRLSAVWHGDVCRPTLTNRGTKPVRVKEAVLFDYRHHLPTETALYGESFQMLSQISGTLGKPEEIGLTDAKHYRIPQPADATVASGLLTLSPPDQPHLLFAYTSCKKFIGRFYVRDGSIQAVVDTEGLAIKPGETWHLEEFVFFSGMDRDEQLARVAEMVAKNHPNPLYRVEPTGWCSYYCFGTKATTEQVYSNLDVIAKSIPDLRYVQIDDGYQPAMGDWLEPGKAFGGDVVAVLKQISARGFEPAIWVAPFIAGKNSRVLAEHPDWFMQSEDGKPLPAAMVTFTGWGGGGWYALDGTHPEVQRHLEHVFRTMREQWGCTYFKLDANYWGAMHGGKLHDKGATRIEAYRRGMEAIRRGAGDAYILGCNQPMWPSLGLVHGSRDSGDINRKWPTFKSRMRESLSRNWQNGRLWWNDPDAVLLTGNLSDDEYHFHATAAYASGGMVLSGDDLTQIPADRLGMLRKLLPPVRISAVFDDPATLEVGRTALADALMVSVFNSSDQPRTITVKLRRRYQITDHWSGLDLGTHSGSYTLTDMPPHSARLLRCV